MKLKLKLKKVLNFRYTILYKRTSKKKKKEEKKKKKKVTEII